MSLLSLSSHKTLYCLRITSRNTHTHTQTRTLTRDIHTTRHKPFNPFQHIIIIRSICTRRARRAPEKRIMRARTRRAIGSTYKKTTTNASSICRVACGYAGQVGQLQKKHTHYYAASTTCSLRLRSRRRYRRRPLVNGVRAWAERQTATTTYALRCRHKITTLLCVRCVALVFVPGLECGAGAHSRARVE